MRAPDPATDLVARARTAFLVHEPLAPGVVRQPILASWTRSRLADVETDRLEVPYTTELDVDTPLTRAADLVVAHAGDELANEPVSVILCDADGYVLRRHTGDARLARALDRVSLSAGFSYAEKDVGTNGIGTALEAGGPARVFGHEHYVEHLEELACAGVPVRHPLTDKIIGVLDLTCWRRDAGLMLMSAAHVLAGRIEELLLEQTDRRQIALLHEYAVAARRNRAAVIGVGNDLLLLNDRARALLGSADQAALLAEAVDALASGERQLVVDLPSGLSVRVLCKPSFTGRGTVDGVLQVQPLVDKPPSLGRPQPLPHPASIRALVGSSPVWTHCVQAVDRHLQSGEWLVLEGEAGTGKATLARAVHRSRNPAAHLRVFDAAEIDGQWLPSVVDELERGGSLVLTHVDRLPRRTLAALTEALEPYRESTDTGRAWLVVTLTRPADERDPELAALVSYFPRTVVVPPLRHHIEDVAELVPHLVGRLNHGRTLSFAPEAMSVLMRNRWPGNIAQLDEVLHKVVARQRSGVVTVDDLPPECRATRRWVLTPLEAIECDAIVDALRETSGSKAEAARLLGMSRATIYRKIRGYGITVPESRSDLVTAGSPDG